MRYALFSDLHADESGFSKLVEHQSFSNADQHICLGDVINAHNGQGAQEYFHKVRKVSDVVLMGNHEAVLVGQCDVSAFNPKHQAAITEAKVGLEANDPEFLGELRVLPRNTQLGDAMATHASFNAKDSWHHLRYMEDIQTEEAYLPAQINFVAHGHIPFIAWKADGYWYYQRQVYDQTYRLLPDQTYVINTGSVLGSREMRRYEKTFLVYDVDAAQIAFFNLEEEK